MRNFVGRKHELLYLEEFCSDCMGNCVCLYGGDGTGKSQLVNEFAMKMSAKYWTFIFKSTQHESPNNYGYQWLQNLLTGEAFFRGKDSWDKEMMVEAKIKDFIKLALSFDKASMEFRLVELFERLCTLLKGEQRLLIIIDTGSDLADDKSIKFFRYLSGKVPKKAKIILVQKNRSLWDLIKTESMGSLALTAFSEHEVTEIELTSSLCNNGNRPDLVQRLMNKTNGNPLYLNIIIKQLELVAIKGKINAEDIDALPDTPDKLFLEIYNSIADKDCLEILRWLSIVPDKTDLNIISHLTLFPTNKIKEILNNSEIRLFFDIKTSVLPEGDDEMELNSPHQIFINILRDKSFMSDNELADGYKKLSAYYLKEIQDNKDDFESLMHYHLTLFLSGDKEAYTKSADGLIEKFYTFMLRESCLEIITRTIEYCKTLEMKQELYVEFINQAGIICHEQRHVDDALDYFNMAIAIYKEIKNRAGEASALGNIGIVYRDIFKTEEAFESLQASLNIYTEIKDLNGQENILTQMWKIDYEMSNFDKAIGYLLKLMVITKEMGSAEKLSSVVGNIGNLYCGSGEFDNAVIYYEQALHIVEGLGNTEKTATYLSRIGIAYLYNGLQYESLEYFVNALKLNQKLANVHGEAAQYGNIGIAYKNIGDLDNALIYFKYALKLFTRKVSSKHIKLMKQNIDTVQMMIKKRDDKTE